MQSYRTHSLNVINVTEAIRSLLNFQRAAGWGSPKSAKLCTHLTFTKGIYKWDWNSTDYPWFIIYLPNHILNLVCHVCSECQEILFCMTSNFKAQHHYLFMDCLKRFFPLSSNGLFLPSLYCFWHLGTDSLKLRNVGTGETTWRWLSWKHLLSLPSVGSRIPLMLVPINFVELHKCQRHNPSH